MLTLSLVILLSVAIANSILGILVLLRDPRGKLNITFFIFVISVVSWTVFNYVTDNVTSTYASLWFARLANVTGLMSVYLFWQFCNVLVKKESDYSLLTNLPILLIGSIVAMSPFAVIEVTGFEVAAIQKLGPAYIIVVAAMVISFVGAIKILLSGMKLTSDKNKVKNIRLILIGLILTFTFAIFTNIVLPIFTNSWNVSQLGPIFTLILVGSVAIGIIKNSLFNIRPIIARSMGYVMSLSFLGIFYGITAFLILDNLLLDPQTTTLTQRRATYVTLALLSGLSFAPAKRLFDKLSNKIFYRDAYDSQIFIDTFTSILVANADINELLNASAELINSSIKPKFTDFVLKSNKSNFSLAKGDTVKYLDKELINDLMFTVEKAEDSLLMVEENDQLLSRNLEKVLTRRGVDLIIRLSDQGNTIGLVLVGHKRSGSIYSDQDKEMFEIIADELSLAVQNSLRYEEIEKFNITLQDEISEATKRLRSTNAKLKALDETKDEFISMASHQLRTPLTSIKGYLSMVLEGDAGKLSDQQKKMLSQAFTSSQRMNYLISDLLNVSRLRTGKFVIENKNTNLAEVIQSELDQLYETATSRGLEIIFEKPDNFPILNMDETKIRQVVMNFIDNAIYYSTPGGTITIRLEATDKTVELTVNDTGIGVPKSEQHNLFNKFYRAGNARKARPDGTGLGLFMAKKVVIAQGGAIIFRSQEGKGSTFGFSFPRSHVEVKNS